jgi:peroxiredoxin
VGYNFGVGREAPQFDLTAHDGSRVSLKQYRGDWFPVVVFLGADQAAAGALVTALSAVADQLWGWRGQLIGIVHGDSKVARAVADQADRAEFPLLVDRDAAVARAYGVYDVATAAVRPYAAIVDRSGKIVWTADGGAAGLKPAALVAAMRTVAR